MSAPNQTSLWHNLASGAESGMDFSSRWFSNLDDITTIQTTRIIPAELNAYLYQMESNVAELADEMSNASLATSFRSYAAARKEAMNTLMYNATAGERTYIAIYRLSKGEYHAHLAGKWQFCITVQFWRPCIDPLVEALHA